jgi:hypothetical protein
MTTVMSSPLAGAEMMTFLAPAVMWPRAFSASVKRPVDSMTRSTPNLAQGSSAGVLALTTWMSLPLTTRTSSSALSAADFFELTALRGIVFQQVGEVVGGHDVADGDDIEFLAEQTLLDECAEDEAADAAETIDSDFDCHVIEVVEGGR